MELSPTSQTGFLKIKAREGVHPLFTIAHCKAIAAS
jgi:hypothetical protein